MKKLNIRDSFSSRWLKSSLKKKGIIFFGLLIAIVAIFIYTNLFWPLNAAASNIRIDFTVNKGDTANDVSLALKNARVIKNSRLFVYYVYFLGKQDDLQAGQYELSPAMNIVGIARRITKGDIKTHTIKIIEGWNIKDIAAYLEDIGICKKEEFLELTNKNYSETFSFLSDKPKTADLEGYIFPDSYLIRPGTEVEDILIKVLMNLDKQLTPDLRAEIVKQKKSVFEIITMASLIEREVKSLKDKKIVSGILWKRMKIGMPLQVDATVAYILDRVPTIEDLKIESPYNTYTNYGLPKGPIANPGIDSIIAAIYPTKTDHLYYISSPSGKTIFSKTFKDHQEAIDEHLK